MSKKDRTIILVLFLLFATISGGFIIFSNYVGLPLGDERNGDNLNIIGYCLAFISLLLAWRVLHFIYFKKKYGDWTNSRKARWRYWVIGTLSVTIIGIPIEFLNVSPILKTLLELLIILGIAPYLYGKYLEEYEYSNKNDGESKNESSRRGLRNKP